MSFTALLSTILVGIKKKTLKTKTTVLFVLGLLFSVKVSAQSLHETELLAHPDTGTELTVTPVSRPKSNCNLNKTVFGWHPYWMNGAEDNYDWDLISDFCFFGYEVDYTTGNATSTHGWATNDAVDTALVKGKQVHLCVMLFANHAAFFGNATARTTLINNLVSAVQTRGAHGINIDFEGVPANQSANLTAFMNDLGDALHMADANYKLSICLYAVDWGNVFDEAGLEEEVDFYTIMGYDYYYSGSSQAGPTDPLYGFSDGYDYSLSRSVSYYLNAGIPSDKLVLGLPYYGREWETTSNTVPSATTGNNVASRTIDFVMTNANGFYVNPTVNVRASSQSYIFQNAGTWRQCWISEENQLRDRYDLVNRRGLKGIGIWALGYDDGFNECWDAISDKLTDCNAWPCSDTLYDEGGPLGNYYNNERFEYTVNPPGATSIQVQFLNFETEANYDTLWIYDGFSTAAPLIGAYHGTTSPGSFTTSQGAFTLKFKSDGGTRAPGWSLKYNCIQDSEPPSTGAIMTPEWIMQDETVTITANDNVEVDKVYWNAQNFVSESPVHWTAPTTLGQANETFFVSDNWTNYSGNWVADAGSAHQTDETNGNSSYGMACPDNSATDFLFKWFASIEGAGTNRRAGMHFMCSDLSLPNRGNSYFVYLRVDADVIQVYETIDDAFYLMASFPFVVNPSTYYDVVATYSSITGEIKVFVDNNYVGSWTDPTPLTTSTGVSLRSGNAWFNIQKVAVMVGTNGTETVLVGPGVHFANCNPNTSFKAGRVESAAVDVNNLIAFASNDFNVDFTAPDIDTPTEQFNDIDTSYVEYMEYFNVNAQDVNSGVATIDAELKKADGTVIVPTTSFSTGLNLTGLLEDHQEYILYVYSCNNAGMCDTASSDGFIYLDGLSVEEATADEVIVYPNPATEQLLIRSQQGQAVAVYDASGRLVHSGKLSAGLNTIQITGWAPGAYTLSVSSRSYTVVKK